MNVGMQIDLIGWFALIAILAAVQGLSGQQKSGRAPWPKAAVGLLILAMGMMLGSVLWTSDGSNTLLSGIMILLGIAAAPLSARRSLRNKLATEHLGDAPESHQDSILSGLALITIGGGVCVALLGLTGWVETDHDTYTWDLRLIAVMSLFIGVWTFAAGLMLWLRLNDYLPKSTPTRTQQRVVIAVLILALGLGALAVIFPGAASILMGLMVILALELGALSALGIAITSATRVLGRHLGMIGAAIAMLGYVQASLFLLALGGLIVAGAVHYLRGRVDFYQIKTPIDSPR
jgi:NAD(P) transhydrogenase subunit beta